MERQRLVPEPQALCSACCAGLRQAASTTARRSPVRCSATAAVADAGIAAASAAAADAAAAMRGRPPADVRVLVVGATGYIGKFVVKELVKRGYQVVAFARERSGIGGKASADDTRKVRLRLSLTGSV